jgi:hypothetical protein
MIKVDCCRRAELSERRQSSPDPKCEGRGTLGGESDPEIAITCQLGLIGPPYNRNRIKREGACHLTTAHLIAALQCLRNMLDKFK